MKTVLFLCTGNYYRSRFAEELFNHRAETERLGWTASSCALAIERGAGNVGAISPLALAELDARGVGVRGSTRLPAPCGSTDLDAAHMIVALSDSEHRGLMRARFPRWEGRTAFWQVEDVGLAPPDVALGLIAEEIEDLIAALKRE